MFLSLLFSILISISNANSSNKVKFNCQEVFLKYASTVTIDKSLQSLRERGLKTRVWQDKIEITDKENELFYAMAEIDKNGVLSFQIYLRDEKQKYYFPGFRGSEFFDMAMQYFSSRVNYIRGEWHGGANLFYLNRRILINGIKPKEAALETWTGLQAARYGFNQAKLISSKGFPGTYENVNFIFFRESERNFNSEVFKPLSWWGGN